jgi:hypothetical protein
MSLRKAIFVGLLISLLALSIGAIGCASSDQAEEDAAAAAASAQAAETAAEAAEAAMLTAREGALAVLPNPVAIDASTKVYGSGFVPNKTVSLLLVGTWTYKGGDLVDPGIEGAITNDCGAFSATVSVSKLASNYGLAAGIYTVQAVQGEDRVASACLIVE